MNSQKNAEAIHATSLLRNTECYNTWLTPRFIGTALLPKPADWIGGVGTADKMLATLTGSITTSKNTRALEEIYIYPSICASSQALDEPNTNVLFLGGDTEFEYPPSPRKTTEQEHLIAVLRSWEKYQSDWDHEGANAPILSSLRAASNFACLLDSSFIVPEPMLNDTGRAGLFWGEDSLYADIEFLENDFIAYYIERNSGRHKGVVAFDRHQIPSVLVPLLKT